MWALHQVITRTPGVRSGTAVFAGTRVPVKQLLDHLDRGGSIEDFVRRYPPVTAEQAGAACALGLEQLIARVPLEAPVAQASLLPRTNAGGAITNPEELVASLVVGKRVLCPACRSLIFKAWPEGWDSHASGKCRGVKGREPAARKAEYKRRYQHLFR